MSDCYKLTYAGLVFAISSSQAEQKRIMLLHTLAHTGSERLSIDQLSAFPGMDQRQLDSLLDGGFLSRVNDEQAIDYKKISQPDDFVAQLETLSVNGKVILADAHGLILASSGYSGSDSEYIAAIATNLVRISEQAKVRIKNQTEKQLWTTGLSWGRFRALCMSLYIGHKQYILVVGGLPDLEKKEFFDIVSFLVRRYGNG